MARYKYQRDSCIEDTLTGIQGIHCKSHEYYEFIKWVLEGNEPDPYEGKDASKIYRDYDKEREASVTVETTEGTFTVNGGFDSSSLIRGEADYQEVGKSTEGVITDSNNKELVLSLETLRYIAYVVGGEARKAFFKKQKRMRELHG